MTTNATKNGLSKDLGLLHVFCIASGAMISSGIFVLPGMAHAQAGPAVILSYFMAALLALVGMLNAAELATAMPKAGGDYFFIARALGPAAGSVSGLLNWFSLSLKSAFAMVGMGAFLALLLPGIDINLVIRVAGLLLCIIFVLLNLKGTEHAGRIQVYFVLGLLVLMALYVFLGFPRIEMTNLIPFMPFGPHKVLATAGFVFVAYGGLIQISGIAEEVRNPSKTIPMAMALSLAVVSLFYVLIVWVTTGVLPSEHLDGSLTPITDGARAFMGPVGAGTLSMAAILAFVSTANAGIMSASRYLLALSRDELLHPVFSKLNKNSTPYIAIIVTGCFMAGVLMLDLRILVEAASLVLIMGFVLSSVCVIILRESRVENYRPSFRAPFYPWLQIVGVIGFTLLIFEMGIEAFAISALLFLIGFGAYWFYGRHRVEREYALLHLIERMTARELVTGALENELKGIIRERDSMVQDRFDELIANSLALDLDGPLDKADLFKKISQAMAVRLDMEEADLREKLEQREQQGSTVLTEFLAIPHVVLNGTGKFDMALVRCKNGVRFTAEEKDIHAIFVLFGTKDERNFHLRTLSALAQLVQSDDFIVRWRNARESQGLKDVLLLGKRYRP